MDLDGDKIKPAEGMLAVKFVDDDDDDDDDDDASTGSVPTADPSEPMPYEGVLALVVSVGSKVTNVKAGSTIVTRPWARDGLKVGGLTLISSYDVAATILA